MKLKKNPTPYGNILSLPLSKLTKMDAEFTEDFVREVIVNVKDLGKENTTHFILNNNLTLHNNSKKRLIQIFNVLLQASQQRNFNLIQLTKN